MPLTCVPTVTEVTGSIVPVAVTLVMRLAGATLAVSNVTDSSFLPPDIIQKATATIATTPAATYTLLIFFIVFMPYSAVFCLLTQLLSGAEIMFIRRQNHNRQSVLGDEIILILYFLVY